MPDAYHLPELTRSLHALGAARDAASEAAHAAILTPLLDARARAATDDVVDVLAALRGEALIARISAKAVAAAQAMESEAARARARAARARELLVPLRAELESLDALAPQARSASSSSLEWQSWVAQLRRVFASADDACRALARLLAEPVATQSGRHWFGRETS